MTKKAVKAARKAARRTVDDLERGRPVAMLYKRATVEKARQTDRAVAADYFARYPYVDELVVAMKSASPGRRDGALAFARSNGYDLSYLEWLVDGAPAVTAEDRQQWRATAEKARDEAAYEPTEDDIVSALNSPSAARRQAARDFAAKRAGYTEGEVIALEHEAVTGRPATTITKAFGGPTHGGTRFGLTRDDYADARAGLRSPSRTVQLAAEQWLAKRGLNHTQIFQIGE